jgi:hypothetical protein
VVHGRYGFAAFAFTRIRSGVRVRLTNSRLTSQIRSSREARSIRLSLIIGPSRLVRKRGSGRTFGTAFGSHCFGSFPEGLYQEPTGDTSVHGAQRIGSQYAFIETHRVDWHSRMFGLGSIEPGRSVSGYPLPRGLEEWQSLFVNFKDNPGIVARDDAHPVFSRRAQDLRHLRKRHAMPSH